MSLFAGLFLHLQKAPRVPRRSEVPRPPRAQNRARFQSKTKPAAQEKQKDNGQLIELKKKLRVSEANLEAALNRVKRIKKNEDFQKKAYNELKKKNDEELDGYDDLENLKLATFNVILTKWENANENKPKGEISQLENAVPATLRSYFHADIEENKGVLD